MNQKIGAVALVVREYDEAIAYYTEQLGFTLIEDTDLGNGKRWVLVAPPGDAETCLLLARATTPEQTARIGDQTGGRVFLFLHTDYFWRDYRAMQLHGVQFTEKPRHEPYGIVAVFGDLYGNRWDLIGPLDDLLEEIAIGTAQLERGEEAVYTSGKEVAEKIKAEGRKRLANDHAS